MHPQYINFLWYTHSVFLRLSLALSPLRTFNENWTPNVNYGLIKIRCYVCLLFCSNKEIVLHFQGWTVFSSSQTSDLFLATIANIGKIVMMGEEARNEKTERKTLIRN